MKKIFVQTPFSKDANSFWRCAGPLSYLGKHSEGEIEVHFPSHGTDVNWSTLDQFDLIFLHRPCRPDDLTVIQIARNMNIPVWVDYDDWLFHLPEWNPHRASYHNPGIQHIMASCIACADIVSVSTQALAQEFLAVNKNTIIVPNAYRSDLFPFRGKPLPPRKPIYAWRGTNTHEGDLLSVEGGLLFLDEKIHFMGSPPYSIISQMEGNSYQLVGMQDAIRYWHSIYQMAPKVMLFPLFDSFFNHCKSNIAWIEALHAGALIVAPSTMAEWKHPGVIGYEAHDSEAFEQAAKQAMAMSESEHQSTVADAFDYMRSKYDISFVNGIRMQILGSIFSPSFERNKRDPYDQLTGMWALSVLKKQPLPRVGDEKQSI